MTSLEEYVAANERWFAGRGHETEESLSSAEDQLGVSLPPEIKWLLSTFGYWHATGISSLEETVDDTITARDHLDLPHEFIVLYNYQDGGAIVLNTVADSGTGYHTVYSVDWSDIPAGITTKGIHYESYQAYTADRLELAMDSIDQEFIDCAE